MPLTVAARNLMLDALGAAAGFISLHTADPGGTGANEVSGGSPAYARKPVAWNAAASGGLDNTGTPAIDVPGNITVTHWGLWNAATSGQILASGTLSAQETFGGQGLYTFNDVDVTLT